MVECKVAIHAKTTITIRSFSREQSWRYCSWLVFLHRHPHCLPALLSAHWPSHRQQNYEQTLDKGF